MNNDGSWGCGNITNGSKADQEIIRKVCIDNPKCVGYYDNGNWLVASTKLPLDCNELGDDSKYTKFLIKPGGTDKDSGWVSSDAQKNE